MKVLADPSVAMVAVEHRDRLMRFGAEHVEAARAAQGGRLVVVDPQETKDDVVQDMIDVLTSMCAQLYGRRLARNRAEKALKAATTYLTKTKSVIVVEDLAVRGMIRNHSLARSIADAGWGEFRRMLAYKTTWYGSRLVVAPRSCPFTKTCSVCGAAKDAMPRSERVLRCETCAVVIDRDLNAARNLAALVAGSSPETQNACGAEGSGQKNGLAKPAATKQESPSRKLTAPAAGNKRL